MINKLIKSIFLTVLIVNGAQAQNVGIGTATPTYKLDVAGSIGHNDFMYHNDDPDTYFRFPGTDQIQMRVGGLRMFDLMDAATDFSVFNEDGADIDFRVEGITNANMIFVDASADAIGFQGVPNTTTIGGAMVNEMYQAIEIGMDGGGGLQATIGWFSGSDVMMIPEEDWYGYVGRSTNAWWRMYSYGFVVTSSKTKKKNIIPINSDPVLEAYVMDQIDSFEPHFYKYKHELDEPSTGEDWTKYRPTMHIGALVEDSPDFIQDEAFSGIEVYGLASLSLAGVKSNRKEIKKMKTRNLTDFGSETLEEMELFIPFSSEFIDESNQKTPVVTVTTNKPNVDVYIINKTTKGFVVKVSSPVSGLTIDWMAMAKVAVEPAYAPSELIDQDLLKQLEVSDELKAERKELYERTPTTSPQGL